MSKYKYKVIQLMPVAADWVALRPSETGYWEDPVCALALVEDGDDPEYRYMLPVCGGDWITEDENFLAFFHKSILDDPEVVARWTEEGKEQWQHNQGRQG